MGLCWNRWSWRHMLLTVLLTGSWLTVAFALWYALPIRPRLELRLPPMHMLLGLSMDEGTAIVLQPPAEGATEQTILFLDVTTAQARNSVTVPVTWQGAGTVWASAAGNPQDGAFMVSSGGRYLILVDNVQNTTRLLDAGTGEEYATLPRRWSCMSDDDAYLATVDDQDVQVWDVAARTTKFSFRLWRSMDPPCLFSPDGRLLAAMDDRDIQLWDVHEDRRVATLRGHWYPVKSMSFSPDGRQLASRADAPVPQTADADAAIPPDIEVRLWNVPMLTTECAVVLPSFPRHADGAPAAPAAEYCAFDRGGSLLVLSPWETYRIADLLAWKHDRGIALETAAQQTQPSTLSAASKDGRYTASVSYGDALQGQPVTQSFVTVTDATGERTLRQFGALTSNEFPMYMDFAPDNRTLAVGISSFGGIPAGFPGGFSGGIPLAPADTFWDKVQEWWEAALDWGRSPYRSVAPSAQAHVELWDAETLELLGVLDGGPIAWYSGDGRNMKLTVVGLAMPSMPTLPMENVVTIWDLPLRKPWLRILGGATLAALAVGGFVSGVGVLWRWRRRRAAAPEVERSCTVPLSC